MTGRKTIFTLLLSANFIAGANAVSKSNTKDISQMAYGITSSADAGKSNNIKTDIKSQRSKYNFNSGWLLNIGDTPEASKPDFKDNKWKKVTLPYAFNEDEAFRLSIEKLTDTVVWYRKHFKIENPQNKRFFIEFEGIRQAGDFYLNGEYIGLHENGVMAFGFDLTKFIKEGDNVLSVRIDNSWSYRERATDTRYQSYAFFFDEV